MRLPKESVNLAHEIINSWRRPTSNFIVVASPLTCGDEVIKQIACSSTHAKFGYQENELAVASFRSGAIKDSLAFANAVASQWGVELQENRIEPDASEKLHLATRSVVDGGRIPIIIIASFHKAIEHLTFDIGAMLRNLEHDHGLRTVIELPIRLSNLQNRWAVYKPGVPFLASDFGQGHSTRTVGNYSLQQFEEVLREYGIKPERCERLYALSGGLPILTRYVAQEAASELDDDALSEMLKANALEMFERFLRWIDPPGSYIIKKLLAKEERTTAENAILVDHDWGKFLLRDDKSVFSTMLIQACARSIVTPNDSNTHSFVESISSVVELKKHTPLVAVFATHWGARHGGINAFNHELCTELSQYQMTNWKLVVVVPTQKCISENTDSCEVIYLRKHGQEEFKVSDIFSAKKALEKHGMLRVVVGHDAITGLFSSQVGALTDGTTKVSFSHMAYGDYYPLKGSSIDAKKKVEDQRELFTTSDSVFAVGPKLKDYVEGIFRSAALDMAVNEFIPSLPQNASATSYRKTPKITFIGRIETNDLIKQSKLAVAAIADAIKTVSENLTDVSVQVIGFTEDPDNETQLKNEISTRAGRLVSVSCLKYSESREETFTAIRDSSLVIMPSFHEGFGLVAWEAISMRIPIIISQNSGIYQLLHRLGLSDKVGSIKVNGLNADESPTDIIALSKVIQPRLLNAEKYHADAKILQCKLKEVCGNQSMLQVADYISRSCASSKVQHNS